MRFLKLSSAVILSSILYGLSFPKAGISGFIFISFIPLLSVLEKEKKISDFFIAGFSFGYLSNFIILYWLVYTLNTYGEMSLILSFVLFLLLNIYLSLYPALFFSAWYFLKEKKNLFNLVLASFIFSGLEFIRGNFLTGFPWTDAGYALAGLKHLPQIADAGGHRLLSFFIMLVNLFVWDSLGFLKDKKKLLNFASAVFCLMFLFLYGFLKVKTDISSHYDEKIVGIVQGNVDQSIKWNPLYRNATMEKYKNLTNSLISKNPDVELIIWPETATPFFFRHDIFWSSSVKRMVREMNRPIFFGTPDYKIVGGKIRYLNTALILDSSGEIVEEYNKLHLVPFGEFIPLYEYLRFLEKLFPAAGIFSSGEKPKIMIFKDFKIAPLICYEAIFPEIPRVMLRKGANVIVNITNDAWFGKTSAPYQHFQIARMRTIEMRAPLLRSANTGISGLIDETGEIMLATGIFVDAAESVRVKLSKGRKPTLYLQYGDFFSALSIFVVLIIIMFKEEFHEGGFKRESKKGKSEA